MESAQLELSQKPLFNKYNATIKISIAIYKYFLELVRLPI